MITRFGYPVQKQSRASLYLGNEDALGYNKTAYIREPCHTTPYSHGLTKCKLVHCQNIVLKVNFIVKTVIAFQTVYKYGI